MHETPAEHKATAPSRFSPLWWSLATVAGAGYSPVAPGTAGGLVGMVLYLGIGPFLAPGPLVWVGLLFTVLLFVAGVAAGNWAEGYFGRKDDSHVVIDEVVGLLVCALFLPYSWKTALLAFFVSRAVDVVKPPPAHASQKLPGGWGIMADDVLASLYGLAALHALNWLVPWV